MRSLTLSSWLLLVFVVSLGFHAFLMFHFRGTMSRSWEPLTEEILKVHSIPIAVLLGGMFGHLRHRRRVPPTLCSVAIGLSIVWSAIIASAWVGYASGDITAAGPKGSVEEALATYSGLVSFLIAGALAYVSGSGATNGHAEGPRVPQSG